MKIKGKKLATSAVTLIAFGSLAGGVNAAITIQAEVISTTAIQITASGRSPHQERLMALQRGQT
jgi:hypothetical protein